ncbi:DUF397 domain-containing protein [Streptomyces incarnatus]|uniref:DUF397 domain-containing protein n=1 Tax=Streptomyces incarnatus TaxID=665007 RepID=UPI001FC9B4FC|nr:DUF397 domain-containing protein [Streptomyces incarnatus]
MRCSPCGGRPWTRRRSSSGWRRGWQVATSPTTIHVRDSKQNPATAPTLALPPAAWQALLELMQS